MHMAMFSLHSVGTFLLIIVPCFSLRRSDFVVEMYGYNTPNLAAFCVTLLYYYVTAVRTVQ